MKKNKSFVPPGDVFLLTAAILFLMPVLYMAAAMFFSEADMYTFYIHPTSGKTLHLIPHHLSLKQFGSLFLAETDFLASLSRSVLYAFGISFLRTVLAVSAGYAAAFYSFPLKKIFLGCCLTLMFIPPLAMQVPEYILLRFLGLLGKEWSLFLIYAVHPVSICIMIYAFSRIPSETGEAAALDGCGSLRCLWSVLLPQGGYAVYLLFMLSFIDVWNMIEGPMVFLQDPDLYPLAILLPDIMKKHPYAAPVFGCMFVCIPLLLYAACRESLAVYVWKEVGMYETEME